MMSKTEKEVKNSKSTITIRVIWALLGLFFVITLISQLYLKYYRPLQTEVAMLYSSSESISFKGVHIRNERPVRYGGADVISYIHPDGSKIGKNSVVAQSYKSREDILLQRRIDELNEKVKLLEAAETFINADKSQLESYLNQISGHHNQLLLNINEGNYSNIEQFKNEYLSLQSKKRIMRNDETNFNEQIEQLENQIASMRSRMSSQPRDVIIDEAGYFVSVVDGYENTLNYQSLPFLEKKEIEDIIKQPSLDVSGEIIGKMIDDYKWRFVGILDTMRIHTVIYEGITVNFRTGGNAHIVQAVVLSVNNLGDGTSIVVFECDTLTPEFASRRVSQFNLLLNTDVGIRVHSDAIHIVNGAEGVYVQNGAELIFKKVRVLSAKSGYHLVADTTDVSGFVSLYDNIVVKGRDLYDGKIVQ